MIGTIIAFVSSNLSIEAIVGIAAGLSLLIFGVERRLLKRKVANQGDVIESYEARDEIEEEHKKIEEVTDEKLKEIDESEGNSIRDDITNLPK